MIATLSMSGFWRAEKIVGAPTGWISCGAAPSISPSQPISIVGWVKKDDFAPYTGFIEIGTTGLHIGFDGANGKITFHRPSVVEVYSGTAIDIGVEAMIAVTHAGGDLDLGNTTLYIDGTDVTAGMAGSGSPSYIGNISIGRRHDGFFLAPATVSRIAIVNRVLSSSEIMSIYTSGDIETVVSADDFISYWRMDEGSGTVVGDSYGSNDGQVIGEANWVSGGIELVSGVFSEVKDFSHHNHSAIPDWDDPVIERGVFGNCLTMEGANHSLTVPVEHLHVPPMTLSFWVRMTESQSRRALMFEKDGATMQWVVGTNVAVESKPDESDLSVGIRRARLFDNVYAFARITEPINDGNWHFVVVQISFPPDGIRLLVDSKWEDTAPMPAGLAPSLGGFTRIGHGRHPNGSDAEPFIGSLDDICFFNRTLTDAELKRLMLGLHPFA